jgi:hypothetical protein
MGKSLGGYLFKSLSVLQRTLGCLLLAMWGPCRGLSMEVSVLVGSEWGSAEAALLILDSGCPGPSFWICESFFFQPLPTSPHDRDLLL